MANTFDHISPSVGQVAIMDDLRRRFADLEREIDRLNGEAYGPFDPRYKALAITHLEIAAMFVNKAITHK